MKTIGTSYLLYVHLHRITSPFYDDEYRCVHYDDDNDDNHALRDTRGFVVPWMSNYIQLARL